MSATQVKTDKCGVMTYQTLLSQKDPLFYEKARVYHEQKRAQLNRNLRMQATSVGPFTVTFPVQVNILYNTDAENISTEQIQSQIDRLNLDYSGLNPDRSLMKDAGATHFEDIAGMSQIKFTWDPNTSIIRKYTSNTVWTVGDEMKSESTGGINPTPGKLNYWIVSGFAAPKEDVVGYSSVPGNDTPETSGIVCRSIAFGNKVGTVESPTELGRTMTHETGHWFGLDHLWGSTDDKDDFVHDTPKQFGPTNGSSNKLPDGDLVYPHMNPDANTQTPTKTTCDPPGNQDITIGDCYFSYMDYVNDNTMVMFTQQQYARMINQIQIYRSEFVSEFKPMFLVRPNKEPISTSSFVVAVAGTKEGDPTITNDKFTVTGDGVTSWNVDATYAPALLTVNYNSTHVPHNITVTYNNQDASARTLLGSIPNQVTNSTAIFAADPHLICFDGSRFDVYHPGLYRLLYLQHVPTKKTLVVNGKVAHIPGTTTDMLSHLWIYESDGNKITHVISPGYHHKLKVNLNHNGKKFSLYHQNSYKINFNNEDISLEIGMEHKFNTLFAKLNRCDKSEDFVISGLLCGPHYIQSEIKNTPLTQWNELNMKIDRLEDISEGSIRQQLISGKYVQNSLMCASTDPHILTPFKTRDEICTGTLFEIEKENIKVEIQVNQDRYLTTLNIQNKDRQVTVNWIRDTKKTCIVKSMNISYNDQTIQDCKESFDMRLTPDILFRVQQNGAVSFAFSKEVDKIPLTLSGLILGKLDLKSSMKSMKESSELTKNASLYEKLVEPWIVSSS